MSTIAVHSPLSDLVDQLRTMVSSGLSPQQSAERVAEHLRHALREPALLAPRHREGHASGYQQHVVHVEQDGSFSVVSLVWLPGQCTPVHDHVSWCAVGVYEGEETETRYRVEEGDASSRLVPTTQASNSAGSVSAVVPPGDIHRVSNSGTTTAISLHVYGADISRLGSSIRRCYDLPVG